MSNILSILYPVFIFAVLVIFSWVLVHLLSIFGVFLAVAYPIWWLISPRQTICVFCRSRKDGERCPICHEIVRKSEGSSPKSFFSAISNGLILLSFSLLSIGVVFAESTMLVRFGFPAPAKSVTFAIPSQKEYAIGQIFPMQIKVNGIKQAINAVRVDFSYNPKELEVVDISTKNSFATIFVQKQIDNKAGFASFAGGLPNPGFSGTDGIFATVYLRGLTTGITTVTFLPSSQVLANNGHGDNVLNSFANASYLIVSNLPNNEIQQSTLQSEATVLGASTESAQTQMIFYDEKQVLGASTTTKPTAQNTKESFRTILLNTLGYIDEFITSFWQKLFKR